MSKVDSKYVDEIAELEVQALLEGLKDPERRANPAFLDKVRKFLKDNNLQTTPETPGMQELMKKQTTTEIPLFTDELGDVNSDMDRRTN